MTTTNLPTTTSLCSEYASKYASDIAWFILHPCMFFFNKIAYQGLLPTQRWFFPFFCIRILLQSATATMDQFSGNLVTFLRDRSDLFSKACNIFCWMLDDSKTLTPQCRNSFTGHRHHNALIPLLDSK